MGWREVQQGELIRWDAPKTIEGAYAGSEERTTDLGENIVHHVETSEGKVSFFGTAILNSALKGLAVGTLVRISYEGTSRKTSKGFRVKEFRVEVWEPDDEPDPEDDGKVPF